MPDALFAVPRLARVYDAVDGPRHDLVHHHAIVDELGARSVLDLGCGTGTFACELAARGIEVTALDPAAASLAVARRKPDADRVRWIEAPATAIPPIGCDVATMTGNVAQVFVDDDEWHRVLAAVHGAIRPAGWFVFEVREPSARGWESWTDALTRRVYDTSEGPLEHWTELTDVDLPFVSFRHHYRFERDGARLTSSSTLRFRTRAEIEASLRASGFGDIAVRDAPDRPGLENVFIARAVGADTITRARPPAAHGHAP